MSALHIRRLTLLSLAACAFFCAGCGGGASGPQTTLSITRDFGQQQLGELDEVPATAGLTAMRQLASTHDVTTSYGGRYVDSVDGLKEDAERSWLFYIDGVEAERGATSKRLAGGERVQWDFHRWQNVRTGGAILGAWPQPLKKGGVRLICLPARADYCKLAEAQLAAAGIEQARAAGARLVVGTFNDVKSRDELPELDRHPESNGAFAAFSADGRTLTPVRGDGTPDAPEGAGSGLLAAFASGGRDVVWLASGTDTAGVVAAVRLLGKGGQLQNRFGLITSARGTRALPLGAD